MHPIFSRPHLLGFAVYGAATLAPAWALDAPILSAQALREQAIAYEHGEGMPRDPEQARKLYCQSARMGDALAQFNLGWMHANGRGGPRDDATAAYFFHAAAEQGLPQAQQMLTVVGSPTPEVPACLRPEPEQGAAEPEAMPDDQPGINYEAIAPRHILKLVKKLAPRYQIDTQLALAIIAAESNFDEQAQSEKKAQGLMQLIPETSERFNVRNPFDPAQNIRGGLTYLRWLLAYFQGDVALVAAAYNAGEGKVDRYKGVPPYRETQRYVKRILRAVGDTFHPFDRKITPPSPLLAPRPPGR